MQPRSSEDTNDKGIMQRVVGEVQNLASPRTQRNSTKSHAAPAAIFFTFTADATEDTPTALMAVVLKAERKALRRRVANTENRRKVAKITAMRRGLDVLRSKAAWWIKLPKT